MGCLSARLLVMARKKQMSNVEKDKRKQIGKNIVNGKNGEKGEKNSNKGEHTQVG